jgi:hypothetical protein
MATFGTLKNIVCTSLGRSDNDTKAIAGRGINAGMILGALLYEPKELRVFQTVATPLAAKYLSLSTLTRVLRVDDVYNETGQNKVWGLPFFALEYLTIPSSLTHITFYAIYGERMYVKPVVVPSETLRIGYFQHPAVLTDDGAAFPYPSLEEFAVAFAHSYTWAAFEEPDSSGLWSKITNEWKIPQAIQLQARAILHREAIGDIQRVMQQGAT